MGWLLDGGSVEQPTVILRGDHGFPGYQEELHRPFHVGPPDRVVADTVQLSEGEPEAALRAQQLIDFLARYPVGPERPFEVRVRNFLQGPLAWESDGCRTGPECGWGARPGNASRLYAMTVA